MDNKVLDEAVEVAVVAYWEDCANGPGYEDSYTADRGHMRAALLASLPVLLGEPVAWLCDAGDGSNCDATNRSYARDDYARFGRKITPLYAPDLGGGK